MSIDIIDGALDPAVDGCHCVEAGEDEHLRLLRRLWTVEGQQIVAEM